MSRHLWRVVDHNNETVFSYDTIHNEPAVRAGVYTARAWAQKLARENSDPELPPLRAVKDSTHTEDKRA